MAFHPAAGRRISGGITNKNQLHETNDNNIDINKKCNNNNAPPNDDIESDFSSDYDQPYHETAYNWYNRHAKRHARRLAGISSSSSSESESSDNDEGDSENEDQSPGDKKRKEIDRAIRSANKPLEKWLASYPFVAARSCLSTPPNNAMTTDNNNHYGGNSQHDNNNDNSPLSTREQETKKLRRIFRRLRRKQKEFQIKFINNNDNTISADDNNDTSYHETSNSLSIEQMAQINQDCILESESDLFAIHSFIPQGIGISFIDATLASKKELQHQQQQQQSKAAENEQQTMSRLVLELNGPARCGQTSILIATAARYVASTSNIFLDMGHLNSREEPQSSSKRCKLDSGYSSSSSVMEPRVVILDIEKGMHAVNLVLAVREAVLRRWDETSAARQWKKEQEKLWNIDDSTAANDVEMMARGNGEEDLNTTVEEQRQIELAIASCLGRINIVQPRDFTYLSLVATIEALGQSLDKEMANGWAQSMKQPRPQQHSGSHRKKDIVPMDTAHHQQAPTLIMIDSLTTLDETTRYLESLSTAGGSSRSSSGSGLSDRNEFYRQLLRLREEHEVTIIATSRCVPSTNNRLNNDSRVGKRGVSSLWDKMVSHRVSLHHAIEGTQEDQAGYDFVATLNVNDNREGPNVFPYSVTAGGVATC